MLHDLHACYQILELAPGASQEAVKRSYREFVKVWHPDRFSGDPKLQQKAQEKLKQINLAYERICNARAARSDSRRSAADTSDGTIPQTEHRQSAPPSSPSSGSQQEVPRPSPHAPPAAMPPTNLPRRFVQILVVVIVSLIVKAMLSPGGGSSKQSNDGRHAPAQPIAEPTVVQKHSDESPSAISIHYRYAPSQLISEAPGVTIDNAVPKVNKPRFLPPPRPHGVYFTVGSTKDEVLAIQGTPTKLTDSVFTYRYSHVFFQDGLVKSWKLFYANPLKVKLLPASQIEAKDYFTVDSTKDEVLAVQGTPTEFTDSEFTYGYSHVYFQNGLVTSWKLFYANPLKVKLLPARQVEVKDYFTVGSTKDEVLAIQGTPTEFSDFDFAYGYSHIYFQNGRVTSWKVFHANPLKARLSTLGR